MTSQAQSSHKKLFLNLNQLVPRSYTVKMISLAKTKFVCDMVKYTIPCVSNEIMFTIRRKPNGERYIVCEGNNRRALLISEQHLLEAMNDVDSWVQCNYESSDPTNSWGMIISGGDSGEANRITLAFSLYDNIPAIDLRNWWRKEKMGVFRPTCAGFAIGTTEKIKAFIKTRELIEKHSKELDDLDQYINYAHRLVFDMYTEVCGKPYNNKITHVLQTIDVEKFIYMWNERTKTLTGFNCPYSPREICTYVLSEGIETMERYIEYSQLLHGNFTESD